jgi:site-specific recombinase XerD
MRLPDEDVGRLRKYLTEAEVQRLLIATNDTEGVHRLAADEHELLTKLKPRAVNDYVFPGRSGRMSRSNVNRMLTEIGQRAGLPAVTPHALRHACGYELAMRGLDTRRLQIYLGHRSITSTTIYTDLAEHATDSVWAA